MVVLLKVSESDPPDPPDRSELPNLPDPPDPPDPCELYNRSMTRVLLAALLLTAALFAIPHAQLRVVPLDDD